MVKLKHVVAIVAMASTTMGFASYEVEVSDGHKIAFGGYIKTDLRYVSGDLGYQDLWLGNKTSEVDTSHLGFNVRESRFNVKYTHGDVSAFVEYDFYGGGGNEVVSNSTTPRIRHAFIKYGNILAGQTWSTFMNTSSLPETLDFAGPAVAEVFIRQGQLRYSMHGFDFAIENPETNGDSDDNGTTSSGIGKSSSTADPDESIPDLIAKYTMKGDWGNVSFGGLFRKIDQGGLDDSAVAFSVAGKMNIGQDDIRFQLNMGEHGRYVGPALTADVVGREVEDTTAVVLAYRHMWSGHMRSSVFFGNATTDTGDLDRTHWGVNLLNNVTKHLTMGVELGSFSVSDGDVNSVSSTYVQGSMKFSI